MATEEVQVEEKTPVPYKWRVDTEQGMQSASFEMDAGTDIVPKHLDVQETIAMALGVRANQVIVVNVSLISDGYSWFEAASVSFTLGGEPKGGLIMKISGRRIRKTDSY